MEAISWIGSLAIFHQPWGASFCVWITWTTVFGLVFFAEIVYHPKNMQGKRSCMFDRKYHWHNRLAVYGWVVYASLLAKFFNLGFMLDKSEGMQIPFFQAGMTMILIFSWAIVAGVGLLSKFAIIKPRRYNDFVCKMRMISFLDMVFLVTISGAYYLSSKKEVLLQNGVGIIIIITMTTAMIKFFQRK